MNSALEVTETETIIASSRSIPNTNPTPNPSCESPCCPQVRATRPPLNQPSISVETLQPIFQSLLVQLSQLLVFILLMNLS